MDTFQTILSKIYTTTAHCSSGIFELYIIAMNNKIKGGICMNDAIISKEDNDELIRKLAVAFEILYNAHIITFEYRESRSIYDDFLEHARYIVNYPLGQSTMTSSINQANEILERNADNPDTHLIRNIFDNNKFAIKLYASGIKEMEAKGLITIKSTNSFERHISYERVVDEILYSGYSNNFESLPFIPKGTILFESPNYIIYKSLVPKHKPDDYIYSVYPNTLNSLENILKDYRSGNYTLDTKVPNEAFNVTAQKIDAVCKLVSMQNGKNNISNICIPIVKDYFNKFYKLSDAQLSKLDKQESMKFIKSYFKTIERGGFTKSTVSRCKRAASRFFAINIED
jgi:hypothetical protein